MRLQTTFMNRVLQPILSLVCLVAGPLQAADRIDDSSRLRILSYNIHHGEGMDGQLNLQRIAGVIRAADPDIVALQEVDHTVRRSGMVDQPAALARLTGLQAVFGGNLPLQGGHYGNAVLTRLEVIHSTNHLLPSLNNGEQRGVLDVELAWPAASTPLRLLVTHLDHRRNAAERLASVRTINELVASTPAQPTLLAGDLNDVPDSPALAALRVVWTSASREPQPTIPVRNPRRQIDYVLYWPAARWTIVETRVLPEAIASDHRPVLAILELRAEDAP